MSSIEALFWTLLVVHIGARIIGAVCAYKAETGEKRGAIGR